MGSKLSTRRVNVDVPIFSEIILEFNGAISLYIDVIDFINLNSCQFSRSEVLMARTCAYRFV